MSFGSSTQGRRDGTNAQDRRAIAFRQKHGRPPSGYRVLFADGTEMEFEGYGVTPDMVDEHGRVMRAEEI